MKPDVTHLHSLQPSPAVRQSRPANRSRALVPVDRLQLSAEARQSQAPADIPPGFLAALERSLKPGAQLPGGASADQTLPTPSAEERRAAVLALARRLQLRDFLDIPNDMEGNRFLQQLRQQLVNGYVGQPELSPEAAMLSQQLAVARARRMGSLPC